MSTLRIDQDSIKRLLCGILQAISLNNLDFMIEPILFDETAHNIGSIVIDLHSLDRDVFEGVRHYHRFIPRGAAQLQNLQPFLEIKAPDWHGARIIHPIQ
jgi:hypothetical protein